MGKEEISAVEEAKGPEVEVQEEELARTTNDKMEEEEEEEEEVH
jgi:hypothetical protein